MSPFYPVHAGERHQRLVRADNSPLHYLEIDRLTLAPAEEGAGRLGERGAVVVPLAGSGGPPAAGDGREWDLPLRRDDVFAAAPWAAYLPRDTSITLRSRGALEAIIVSAPAAGPGPPAPGGPPPSHSSRGG